MTKRIRQAFFEELATQMDCSVALAEKNFDACIDTLKKMLMRGEELTIPGFGRFYVHKSPDRTGYDPKRKIKIPIAARSVPMFKAGDALKIQVNSW